MTILLKSQAGDVFSWREVLGDPPYLRNAAGLSELRYRIGTHNEWVEMMIHALMEWDVFPLATGSTEVSSSGTFMSRQGKPMQEHKRRIRLNLSEEDNWILGLLNAWGTVSDVLTFYQERLINEGYLRTARQPLSVVELARLLDQRPEPAVGGSVGLAVAASEVEGLPPRVILPSGSEIISVPPPGADPQHFETGHQVEAWAEWNLLEPQGIRQSVAPVLTGGSMSLDLAGGTTPPGPGAGLLIRGAKGGESGLDVDDQPVAFFRRVSEVGSISEAPAHSAVRWRLPLDSQRQDETYCQLAVYALRLNVRLFGHNAGLWQEESVDIKRQFRPIAGGVQVLSGAGRWQSLNDGLPELTVQCLVSDAQGRLFAGTQAEGVFRRAAGDDSWRRSEGGPTQLDVRCLVVEAGGGVLAGTSTGGIYRSTDGGAIWTELTGRTLGRARWNLGRRSKQFDRLPETPVRALIGAGEGDPWSLLAGTDSGIYRSTDLADSWLPSNNGLPGVDAKTGETSLVVIALVPGASRTDVYAGTTSGVFKSSNQGKRWRAINRGLPGTDLGTGLTAGGVKSLIFYRDQRQRVDHLFAGTSEGTFHSSDGGVSWKAARQGMTGGSKGFPEITTLVAISDPITVTCRLFAGGSAGLWRSENLGESWSRVELGVPGVMALAAGPRAELAVASPLGGFDEEEWPGFHLSRGRIDLEREVPGLSTGTWVVLVPDPDVENPPEAGFYEIRNVTTVRRRDFRLDVQVTRVEVDPDPALQGFDLRRTRAYLNSEALKLLPQSKAAEPVTALAALRSLLAEMPADRPVVASADRAAASAAASEPTHETESSPEIELTLGDPSPDDRYANQLTAGELADALAAAVKAGGAELRLRAEDFGTMVDPFATPRTVGLGALSLAVQGNLVEATEGRTIRDEVLGSGDASLSLQRFPLSEPPAYLRGAPAARSTIEVRVQGQPWREVSRLYGEGTDQRIFEVQRDHMGRATIVFGDGLHGARLPSGHGNVVANYRTGTSDREILPGSVRLMSSRPLGLGGINNPLAGTPGAPAEDLDSIRERAPRSILTMGRIVSLRDYEDFAWGFPGVAKATARRLALAGREVIQVTLATRGRDHRPVAGSRLLPELLAAIEEIRCDPEPVHLAAFRPVGLEIEASIRLEENTVWEEVKPLLAAAMEERFSFATSRFGSSWSASEAIRVLQSVPGIVAVDLDVFRRLGDPGPLARRVEARLAFWDGRSELPTPAELVWLEKLSLHEQPRQQPGTMPEAESLPRVGNI